MSDCCDSIIDCEIIPEEVIPIAVDNTLVVHTEAYTGVDTTDILMNVDNENLTISAEFAQSEKINELIEMLDNDDFGKVDDVKIDNNSVVENKIAEIKTINEDYNSSTNKLATENDIPTSTSDLTNDGDGESPFATEEYVQQNGGKIDTISVNGVEQTIDPDKNVDITVPTQASDVHALPDSTKYGASLAVSGTSLSLKDQNGSVLNTISTQDTGATSVEVTGNGNGITNASYDASNRKITLTKGESFLKTSEYIVDNSLSTSSENPVQNKVIAELIPNQASSSNQLADKDFVNSSINSLAAYYITRTAQGDNFNTYAQLISTSTFYSGGLPRVPTQNDYTYVRWDENKGESVEGYSSFTTTDQYIGYYVIYQNEGIEVDSTNKDSLSITPGTTVPYINLPTTRYSYQGGTYPSGQWDFQLIVNNSALTAAQLAAINSGITSTLVTQIGTNQSNITNLSNNKVNTSTTIAGVDLQDDITKSELLTAINVEDGAQKNDITFVETPIAPSGVNPLLVSNPNLLINSDFRVNQRGLTTYTEVGYCIDYWTLDSSASLTVLTEGVSITGGFRQFFDKPKWMWGKTFTLSIKTDSGITSKSGTLPSTAPSSNTTLIEADRDASGVKAIIRYVNTRLAVVIYTTTANANVYWVKVELGSVPTLYCPRPYSDELAICQVPHSQGGVSTTYSNPNLLINGDFRVNQRGFTTNNSTQTYTVDRWYKRAGSSIQIGYSNNNITATYLSSGTGTLNVLEQTIDKVETLIGKTITGSINVSSITGSNWSLAVSARDLSSQISYQQVSLTQGLNTVSYTVPNNTVYLRFAIVINRSSASINDTITFNECKLEVGSVATMFSSKPYAEELPKCMRYYQIRSSIYTIETKAEDRPIPMRVNGTIGTTTIDSTTYNYVDSEIY